MTHKISGVPIAIIGGLPMRWVVTCLLVALLGSLDSATFAAKPVPTYRWEPVTLKAPFAAERQDLDPGRTDHARLLENP